MILLHHGISDVSFNLNESIIWLGNIESSHQEIRSFRVYLHAQHPIGSLQETELISSPIESSGSSRSFVCSIGYNAVCTGYRND